MPLLRAGPSHFASKRRLKSGEAPITDVGDTKAFRFPCRQADVLPLGPGGDSHLEGDLLAYGWRPESPLLWAIALLASLFGMSFGIAALARGDGFWLLVCLAVSAIGVLILRHGLRADDRRFVVFDRRRGLVHISRRFGPRPDAVRWQDLSVLVLDGSSPFGDGSMETAIYVARPGRSLLRFQYPRRRERIRLGVNSSAQDEEAEQSWRQIAIFMSEPREDPEWVVREKWFRSSVAALSYGNDWTAMRRAESRMFRHLYGSELLTEPNWVCDDKGRWQRQPVGPRERIELPDGPQEKRVPVSCRGGFSYRLRRAGFFGAWLLVGLAAVVVALWLGHRELLIRQQEVQQAWPILRQRLLAPAELLQPLTRAVDVELGEAHLKWLRIGTPVWVSKLERSLPKRPPKPPTMQKIAELNGTIDKRVRLLVLTGRSSELLREHPLFNAAERRAERVTRALHAARRRHNAAVDRYHHMANGVAGLILVSFFDLKDYEVLERERTRLPKIVQEGMVLH